MATSIQLDGSKAERFEVIKEALRNDLGDEPTNAEVIGHLMAHYFRG